MSLCSSIFKCILISFQFCNQVFADFVGVYMCLCVCVCVFILFHRKDLFRLQWCLGRCKGLFGLRRYLGHTWGYGSTILCCEYYSRCFFQVSSSSFLNMSCFTSKDETPSADKLETKRYNILHQRKDNI